MLVVVISGSYDFICQLLHVYPHCLPCLFRHILIHCWCARAMREKFVSDIINVPCSYDSCFVHTPSFSLHYARNSAIFGLHLRGYLILYTSIESLGFVYHQKAHCPCISGAPSSKGVICTASVRHGRSACYTSSRS